MAHHVEGAAPPRWAAAAPCRSTVTYSNRVGGYPLISELPFLQPPKNIQDVDPPYSSPTPPTRF